MRLRDPFLASLAGAAAVLATLAIASGLLSRELPPLLGATLMFASVIGPMAAPWAGIRLVRSRLELSPERRDNVAAGVVFGLAAVYPFALTRMYPWGGRNLSGLAAAVALGALSAALAMVACGTLAGLTSRRLAVALLVLSPAALAAGALLIRVVL